MYHGNLQAFDFSSNRHLVSRSSICMKNPEIVLICSMVFGGVFTSLPCIGWCVGTVGLCIFL